MYSVDSLFDGEPPKIQPSRQSTMEDFVMIQPIHAQLEALGQRMGRIESTLDKILERLQLPSIYEAEPWAGGNTNSPPKLPDGGLQPTSIAAASNLPQINQAANGQISLQDNGSAVQHPIPVPELLPGQYSYTSLDTSKSQVRVLALQHANNFSDPIIAGLKIVDLDDPLLGNMFQGYTALSYCWGPPVMDGSILLGGHLFPVTKSLESALRHLRGNMIRYDTAQLAMGSIVQEEYWWVDQICINQADIDERSSQVSLMRRIYKRSSAVHVWLGDEADDSSTAMDILATLGGPPQHAPGEKAIQYPSFTTAEVENNWKAIDAFLKRPWWERVWIRQEIALSFNVKVSCGSKTFEMGLIGPAIFMLNYVKGLGYEPPVMDRNESSNISTLPWDFHPRRLVELRDSTNAGYTWVELSRLLLSARGCKATDARDFVFSVIGLADPEQYPLVPNYRDSQRDILLAAASAAVQREYGLDILAACQNPERKHGFPSWVPNLADPWKTRSFNLFDAEGRNRMSELRMTSEDVPDAEVDDQVLIIRGGLIDEVQLICSTSVNKGADAEELEAVYMSMRKFVDDAAGRGALHDYEAYEYVEEESEQAKERLWIKLLSALSDKAEDLDEHSYRNNTYKKKTKKQLSATAATVFEDPDWKSNPYHHLGLNYRLGRSYLLPPGFSMDHLHPNRRVHTALETICVGRRLCITNRGMLALIPAEAEEGDSIAIFHGAAFPYILRKSDDCGDHVLVGEAFIPRYVSRGGESLCEDEWEVDLNALIRLC